MATAATIEWRKRRSPSIKRWHTKAVVTMVALFITAFSSCAKCDDLEQRLSSAITAWERSKLCPSGSDEKLLIYDTYCKDFCDKNKTCRGTPQTDPCDSGDSIECHRVTEGGHQCLSEMNAKNKVRIDFNRILQRCHREPATSSSPTNNASAPARAVSPGAPSGNSEMSKRREAAAKKAEDADNKNKAAALRAKTQLQESLVDLKAETVRQENEQAEATRLHDETEMEKCKSNRAHANELCETSTERNRADGWASRYTREYLLVCKQRSLAAYEGCSARVRGDSAAAEKADDLWNELWNMGDAIDTAAVNRRNQEQTPIFDDMAPQEPAYTPSVGSSLPNVQSQPLRAAIQIAPHHRRHPRLHDRHRRLPIA